MRKTPAIAARILAGALAFAAHTGSGQTPDTPSEPPVAPGVPPVAPAAVPAPAAPTSRAPGVTTPRAGEVVLNFQGADLQAVVKAMSQMTGRNMLIDPRVR
ncbi:MAG TPA: hypothetical protein VEM33_02840, partial [Burkholderiales bacterium]|nr:hypothetical protein [Burkholderiales bacterium]